MSERDDLDWTLIGRYLHGECDDAEAERVRARLDRHPDGRGLLEDARWLLRQVDELGAEPDVEAAWRDLQPALDEVPARPARRGAEGGLPRRIRAPVVPRLAAAAVVVFIGLGAWVLAERLTEPEPAATWTTAAGETRDIRLEDGTAILLGYDSRLEVPPGFNDRRREVRLDGMAFLDVARDPARTFLIRTAHLDIEVRGTRLGVSGYAREPDAYVVVETGEVAVRTLGGSREPVLLRSGQVGRYRDDDGRVTRERVERLDPFLAWRDGRLVVRNEPLASFARRLERRYDVVVVVGDSTLARRRITAALEDPALEEVLDVISLTMDATYTRTDGAIFIAPSKR